MRVPGGAGAGLEGDGGARDAGRGGGLVQRVDSYGAGEIFVWSSAGRLRTAFVDIHVAIPICEK